LLIRCTQKLLKELSQSPIKEESESNNNWSWHANIFLIERRKCILATHDLTLFSVFIPFLKKPDFKHFNTVWGQNIFKYLLYEEIPQKQLEIVLSESEEIKFTKTNNRSVLGSMNDMKFQLEYHIHASGGLNFTDIYELNHNLNRTLFSATGYNQPIEMFKKQLEQSYHVDA
jgi:hypothetical protein